jgi:hypothetical protein
MTPATGPIAWTAAVTAAGPAAGTVVAAADFAAAGPTLVGLGGAAVLAGLVLAGLTVRRRRAGRRATGTSWGRVVAVQPRRQVIVTPGEISSPVHLHPTVAFVDGRGRQRTWTSPVGTTHPRFQVGQPVLVRYDPDDPSVVRLGASGDPLAWVGLAVGAFLVFVGVVLLVPGVLVLVA